MDPRFSHISEWIFDLDNCLYPASTGLFSLIDERMGAYIERLLGVDAIEARRVQKMHFHGSGTTLAGLMKHHEVDPHHFMGEVHDIPLDRLGLFDGGDVNKGIVPAIIRMDEAVALGIIEKFDCADWHDVIPSFVAYRQSVRRC